MSWLPLPLGMCYIATQPGKYAKCVMAGATKVLHSCTAILTMLSPLRPQAVAVVLLHELPPL